uniref:Cytochrome P450 705A32-2 n=1 Tax=Isatis tinctoria TaxID=161756 RepID=A0A8F0FRM4_ISATI|nr:cytochrome P450 705A32-2 [Isatis tinctoria]
MINVLQNCFILILLCLFSLLCFFVFFFKKPKDGSDLPPSPPSMPIIGHLHLLLSSLFHKSFQKISSKYGPLLHLRIFNVPIVLVSAASVANEIFKAHDVNISSRGLPPIDESLFFGSSGFFSAPHGDYWKFMKKLVVAKLLGPQAIERSRAARAEELERFYFDLLNKAMRKETVEIRAEAMKFTNNSTCKMIIGRSCGEDNGESERVRGLITESIALSKKVLFATLLRKPLEKLGISLFRKEIMDISGRYDELLERFLVEHEEKLEKHHHQQGKDLMDVLLEAKGDENAEHKITRDHIKSLFVELFLGGTDTSKQTIQWTMAEIINNPKTIERLREEMDSVVGKSRLIQETDLPNLPYLQAVVKEGLRLYPPVPLFGRRLQEGFNGYAIMRDPNDWEDPDEFKPERFLASSNTTGQEDESREHVLKYFSFGSGRRGCPGSNLAYIFLGTAIGMMVQCFDWKIKEDKVNMEETLSGMVLTMAHPLKCTPVPRICSFPVRH